jgi:ABC-type multidrug transport system fused ATPase/permease subunit
VAGHTGSGKSTLARLLCRFCDPERGSVRVGGVDLRRADMRSLRSRVAWVTQEVQLLHASLRDNITLFDPAVSDQRLIAVLAELGLGPWLGRLPGGLDTEIAPGALSAGEAQLLALARAFLGDPGLVILDEASSRLDPETAALAERALDSLLKGRTGIIIAHRPETLRRADLVLVLEGGRQNGEVAV